MAEQKPLKQELFDEPYRFEFFQAVRLLEKIFPEKKAVAGEAMPDDEIVRFRSHVSLDFPPSQIHSLEEVFDEKIEKERTEMFINFMGMVGVSGVLPVHYTELVMSRIRYRDTTMHSFLDIFTHRSVSMFFRAWEKYRFPIAYERGNDDFTRQLFSFAGIGTKGLRGRLGVEDETLLPYAGLIAQKPHSSSSLKNILADYFQINAKIEQFFGQWLELDTESITKLGKANYTLGGNALIGTRVWDQQSKFRVVLGALPFGKFRAFLPDRAAHESLKSIIKFIVGLDLDFDVQLILQAKQVPSTILTTRAKRRPQLGWSSWLKSKPFTEDDGQVILQVS